MLSTIPYSGGFANKISLINWKSGRIQYRFLINFGIKLTKTADTSVRISQKYQRLISKYSVKTYVVILVVYAVQRFRLSS